MRCDAIPSDERIAGMRFFSTRLPRSLCSLAGPPEEESAMQCSWLQLRNESPVAPQRMEVEVVLLYLCLSATGQVVQVDAGRGAVTFVVSLYSSAPEAASVSLSFAAPDRYTHR